MNARRGNPETIKASAKAWRDRNREHLREYMRAWREAHRDQLRDYNRAYQPSWLAKNRHRSRGYRLKANYGVTTDQYRDMLIGQAGRCLICLRVPDHDLHVDHSHVTGEVRGLLCRDCNGVLGLSRDDPTRLRRAIRYLGAAS